jgi:thiol-disulfide isomerase/thioredoxin
VVFGACLLGGCAEEPEVRLADGSTGNWDQWQGRWMLINYWAEWCAPCREEIPELNRLHEDGADGQLVVLGVNFDGLSGEALSDLVERMDIGFPVLLDDPRARWQQPMPGVLPSTLVVDPEGKLRTVLVGPQTFETLSRAVQVTSAM